ncbi:MAG: hypothetical protein HZA89_05155 [Verrucomicrobia bacterium]|nr:hypothetical protein [Verrucomicrobiota bacterium]
MKFIALTAALIFVLSGCSKPPPPKAEPPKPITISGQVFIVRGDRETVKLSMTPVVLVESKAAHDQLTAIQEKTKEIVREFLAKPNPHDEEIKMIEGEQAAIRQQLSQLNSNQIRYATSYTTEQRYKLYETKEKLTAEIDSKGRHKIAVLQSSIAFDEEKLKLAKTERIPVELFNQVWRGEIARTQTDADGNFSFTASPTNRYMVIAYGSRKVADKSERYCWAEEVTTNEAPVLLNNANLFQVTAK